MHEAISQGPWMSCFLWEGFNCLYFHVDSEQHVYVCGIPAYENACVCTYMYMSRAYFLMSVCHIHWCRVFQPSPHRSLMWLVCLRSHCLCLPSIGLTEATLATWCLHGLWLRQQTLQLLATRPVPWTSSNTFLPLNSKPLSCPLILGVTDQLLGEHWMGL